MLKFNQMMITLSGLGVLLLALRGAALDYWNYALIAAILVFVSTSLWALGGLRRMRKAIEVGQEAYRGN